MTTMHGTPIVPPASHHHHHHHLHPHGAPSPDATHPDHFHPEVYGSIAYSRGYGTHGDAHSESEASWAKGSSSVVESAGQPAKKCRKCKTCRSCRKKEKTVHGKRGSKLHPNSEKHTQLIKEVRPSCCIQ